MNRDTVTPSVQVSPPGPASQRWTDFHMQHAPEAIYFHDLVWDRSKPAVGPFLKDPDDNILLDFSSHGAAFPLGYNHSELVEAARNAARTAPDKCGAEIVAAWGPDPENSEQFLPSRLLHKITSLTKPHGLYAAFLSNSGSEAVENSFKLCYAHRRNLGNGFCFERAFHGRSLEASSHTCSRLGKTLRMGAIVVRRGMFPEETGRFGGTWSGTNAIDAAVGGKVLEIIARDGLLDNSVRVGQHPRQGFRSLTQRYSFLRNPRGIGLMLGLTMDG